MTSTAKTGITADTSGLADLTTAEASDVLNPVNDLLAHVKSGRLGVTAADLNVKHLYDAIAAGSGVTKTLLNPGADEQLQLAATGDVTRITSGLLASPAASISIAGIPGTYRHLLLRTLVKSAGANTNLYVRFNGTTAGYKYAELGAKWASSPSFDVGYGSHSDGAGISTALRIQSLTSLDYAVIDLLIYRYASSGSKYVRGETAAFDLPSANTLYWARGWLNGRWTDAAAISQIDLIPATAVNIDTGSSYDLYGIN